MSYLTHAEREFKATGWDFEEDGPNRWLRDGTMALLKVFAEQGHSGSSAPYAIDLFKKLASYEPLAPLQGTDDEWVEVGEGVWQNARCSHVFKQTDRFAGQPYDINGKIFREPDGICYTNSESFVPVTFPYTPKSEYVDVPASHV